MTVEGHVRRIDREQLAVALHDADDDSANRLLDTLGGPDAVLRGLFDTIEEVLDSNLAEDCTVNYELGHFEKTYQYCLTIDQGRTSYRPGATADARLTFAGALIDYLRLVTGNLDGLDAFLDGRLEVRGDLAFAEAFRRMFRTTRPVSPESSPSEQSLAPHAENCLGCSTSNPRSLGMTWDIRDGGLRSTVELPPGLDGPPGHAHGGVIATVLDEAMAALAQTVVSPSVTTTMTVRYRRLVPLETPLTVTASVNERSAASVSISAQIEAGRQTMAEAVGVFHRPLRTRRFHSPNEAGS